MKLKVIRTKEEYEAAIARIYYLVNSTDKQIESGSDKGDEIELLSLLVERYEEDNFPISAPDPIEAIKLRMEQMNLKQKDISPLFGGETRASEVLNGKRQLTLKMITLLNRYLDIPLESLIMGNTRYKLDPGRKKKILKVPELKEFLSKRKTAIL